MKLFGSRELLEHVIHKNLCIGCGACQELCPYFRSYRGKTAMLFPCTKDKGRCFAYCPRIEVDLDELSNACFGKSYNADPLGHYLTIRIARAGESVAKSSFQSGGTVSALMLFALKKGYIDGAILTAKDGIATVPRIATTAEDIRACASSKYAATPTLAALNQAVKSGMNRLGVVSTPCQTLAVAQMRTNPMADGAFHDPVALSVGLFCTWSLDFRAFAAFMAERLDVNLIKKIDIPPPPAEVMEVYTEEGEIEFSLKDIRKLVPEACSYCFDMTAEFSDISVGVVEGRNDANTIVVRTERGRKLVDEAWQEGWLVLEELPAENLEHLRWAAGNKKKRALVKGKEKGLIGASSEDGIVSLRMNKAALDGLV